MQCYDNAQLLFRHYIRSLHAQAALAEALRSGSKSRKNLACDVISYSTAASQSSCSVVNLLQCLVRCLRQLKEEEVPLPISYKWVHFILQWRMGLFQHIYAFLYKHIYTVYCNSRKGFAVRVSCHFEGLEKEQASRAAGGRGGSCAWWLGSAQLWLDTTAACTGLFLI